MHSFSVQHIPATVDACPMEGAMHLRLRVQKGLVRSVKLIYNCDKNFWHVFREEAAMTLGFSDSELEYFIVAVPVRDTRFAYIFQLDCVDGKTRYFSEEGLTGNYDHSLGYFSFFQYTSQFPCDTMTVPQWVRTGCCYQIFPERFAMGHSGKDTSYLNTPWGQIPTPKSYCGGDLFGIRERLPYLVDLGINVLYLTPVFCSPTNHKYEITDYENVDPAFGGNAALKELIGEAHGLGIRVILDGVFNHCSWQHPFFLDAVEKGVESEYRDWFFWKEDGSYQTFGSVKTMPKLNTGNSAVIGYFSRTAANWMKNYGVDGWRLDVSDEISHRFLRHFREAVMDENPEAIIIGEDWHRAVRYLNGDEYDGIMNYGLTKALLDLLAFRTIDSPRFRDRLVRLYHTYSIAANEKMLNLLGSHDTHRFLTRVDGDRRKLMTAIAVMFFYPGIPCVYYGDEIGTEGGYDPDCRRCFDWEESHWDSEIRNLVKKLTRLKKEPALSSGTFAITEEKGIITMLRQASTQTVVLRVNGTDQEKDGLPAFGFDIKLQ